jgi:hypothetical protein
LTDVNGGLIILTQGGIKIPTLMKMFTYYWETRMIREEQYLRIRDLAQEQEITTGYTNISKHSRETGYDRKIICVFPK